MVIPHEYFHYFQIRKEIILEEFREIKSIQRFSTTDVPSCKLIEKSLLSSKPTNTPTAKGLLSVIKF